MILFIISLSESAQKCPTVVLSSGTIIFDTSNLDDLTHWFPLNLGNFQRFQSTKALLAKESVLYSRQSYFNLWA